MTRMKRKSCIEKRRNVELIKCQASVRKSTIVNLFILAFTVNQGAN